MNRIASILLYDLVFFVLCLAALFVLILVLGIIKRITFNRWAFQRHDTPLSFNQVWARRLVGDFELYSSFTPYIAFFCIFISVLSYAHYPFIPLYFYAITFSFLIASTDFGNLYTSSIVSAIGDCCLFLRPFELEAVSINGKAPRNSIYRGVSGTICQYLSYHLSPVFSIGNPQGMVDNILYSISIYASNEEWKKTVASLAEKAQVIVVHLGDSEGCIWELKHCSTQQLLDKVIFIIDSQNKLEFLRQMDIISNFSIPDSFLGTCMFIYKDLKEEKWKCESLVDVKNTDDEIKTIMCNYFSSRKTIHLKNLFSDSDSIDFQKIINWRKTLNELFASPIEKPWPHRLSFFLGPFGYLLVNRWGESPITFVLGSLLWPYLLLIIVGLFGLGRTFSVIVYALLFIILALWAAICPAITGQENYHRSGALCDILNKNLLRKTCVSFLVSYLLLTLLSSLHHFGLDYFGLC